MLGLGLAHLPGLVGTVGGGTQQTSRPKGTETVPVLVPLGLGVVQKVELAEREAKHTPVVEVSTH